MPAVPVAVAPEVPQKTPVAQSADWTGDEIEAAFAAIESGEKLRAVADRFGKSWTVLRGKWGRSKGGRGKVTVAAAPAAPPPPSLPALTGRNDPPLVKVQKAITELGEQAECRLCGRHFERTPDRLDTCARCSHGA